MAKTILYKKDFHGSYKVLLTFDDKFKIYYITLCQSKFKQLKQDVFILRVNEYTISSFSLSYSCLFYQGVCQNNYEKKLSPFIKNF